MISSTATTAEKITELQRLVSSGEAKIACGQVLEVVWSEAVTRYYGWANIGELAPFVNIPFGPIQPAILGDPFSEFEVDPDLRTDTIQITFDNIKNEIKTLFQRYGTVRCRLWNYWPDVDLLQNVWYGQLQRPPVYGVKIIQTTATNGYWSREKMIPHSMRPPDHCRFEHFGGELNSRFQLETNGCPYDRQIGGTTGLLNGSVPFTQCPKDEAACSARFGHTRFFGGYSTDASATVSDGNTGYLAISKGNSSSNTRPIPVIAGTKHVRGFNLLMYRREPNASDPDRGFMAFVFEIGDGQCRSIRNLKVGDKLIEQQHLSIRGGVIGQAPVANYNAGGSVSNFSGVCHFSARRGWMNPADVAASSMMGEGDIEGYVGVAVFNPTESGNGLVGYYFSDHYLTILAGYRVDANIEHASNYEAPLPGMSNIDFGIRWLGVITFPFAETYTITIDHDDESSVWIGGTLIVDGSSGPGLHSGTFTPVANQPYAFRCDFVNADIQPPNPWRVTVSWSSASTPQAPIPTSAFTHDGSDGYVRQFSRDRVWWTLEMYTNMRLGLGYDVTAVNTGSFNAEATHKFQTVTFNLDTPDGDTRTFTGQRSKFDAILEGRSAVDQIVDTVRSGALCVPFQHDGELTIRSFRAFTDAELAAAPIFTDKIVGQTSLKRRITQEADGPAIQVLVVPDEQLPNEITTSFEAADNQDAARPITSDDPNQKLKAGKQLGDNGLLLTVPKQFAAFGIRELQEAVRLNYRLLWFGDEGAEANSKDTHGIKNNCKVTFSVPYEYAMDLVRYGPIKIDSDLLIGHGYGDPFGPDATPPSVPEGYGAEFVDGTEITLTLGVSDDIDAPAIYQFEWFRILQLRRIAGGQMRIIAQAYNKPAYDAFEIEGTTPTGGGGGGGGGDDGGGIEVDGDPCVLKFESAHYDAESQSFSLKIQPC